MRTMNPGLVLVSAISIVAACTRRAPAGGALTGPEAGREHAVTPDLAEEARGHDFEGILDLSECSGSLVRFDDSQDTDKALVLSNGHCVRMIEPGAALFNQSASRSFDVLSATASKLGSVRSERLLYATMTKTDVSLYRLTESYQEILTRYKTRALTLAREIPPVDAEIEVISGYLKRGYTCRVEAIVHALEEGDWTFDESMRYSRPGCEVIGGTSGSPVLAAGTRTVIAVSNTINEDGEECTVNNPCELDGDGTISYQKGYGYAQQTAWFYSCRDEQGQLDLDVKGCLLPRPATAATLASRSPGKIADKKRPGAQAPHLRGERP